MTELDPESAFDDSNEADFLEQGLEVEGDLDAELDDPARLELEDDAWDADLADLAEQRTEAPFDDDE